MADIELVVKIDESIYRDVLLGNVFVNRAILQKAFENAKLIIEADKVESESKGD